MQILLFIKGLGLGGAERHVVDSAISLRDRGYSVTVAYMLRHKKHFVPQLEAEGIHVVCVGPKIWGLYRLLKRLQPQLVHAHLPVPALYTRILKAFFSFRLVTTHHNVLQRQKSIMQILERAICFLDDATISCSKQVATSIPWKTKTIENGIRIIEDKHFPSGNGLRGRLGISETAVVCLCTANLVPKKNHKMLLKAFDSAVSAAEGVLDAHLVLIGQDGTDREKLTELSRQLPAVGRIHFWGADDSAPVLAWDADIFCLASHHEGLPLALLEAMASGLPAVVTDVGGMSSVVETGISGFVVKRGDIQGFSEALEILLTDPEMRADMGAAAKQTIKLSYGLEPMIDQMVEVYQDVVRSTGMNRSDT